ncbi:TPA: hypothetical protein TZY74_001822 [Streptococcus suis]|nr:hypothetical protein [Streptococcus suis]HEL2473334.1 hypothetical protein [Streptococcus suis]HEM4266099.1 hypothetical protein [Streptococcus suis]HEP1805896.1 hypothetical protein [Streptococcus suis]
MAEEVQKYVVVGNGFDLNLGIKSSYGDFVEYIAKEHKLVSPQEIYSLNSLFIQKFDGTQLNWSDFETEFENQIFLIESKNEPAERKRYEVDKLNASIQQLEDDFYYYLSEQYDFWKREALGRDNKIENVNPLYQNIFNNANVISFNYTPSLEDLGLYPHCEHFYRIHGSLERKNIIFGGGLVGHLSASVLETEGATVNDKLVRIKKDTFLSEEREQLLQNLHDEKAIELYILGHSVYGSDLDFLSILLEKAQKIYLFYYDQDYQAKMQNLIKHFSRNMLEKIELVPFLDVVKRGGESYYFELDSENWEHQSYLQMFRDVFRVNIPRKQEFSKFWLSTSNFSIKDIQKIEIKDPVGLMNYEWFLSLFQVDDSRKELLHSIPIVIENINNITELNSLLHKDILRVLLHHSRMITIRNCCFTFSFLWEMIQGGKCENLLLENNKIFIDLNDELNLSALEQLRKVNISNNKFYSSAQEYDISNFYIRSANFLPNKKLFEIRCINNIFKDTQVIDVSVYKYAEFANKVELPFLELDHRFNKFTFKNPEKLILQGDPEKEIDTNKEIK